MIKKILLGLFILVMIPVLLFMKLIGDITSGDPYGPKSLGEAARLMIDDIPRKPIEPTAQGYLDFMTAQDRERASEHFAKLMLHAERQEAVPMELEDDMILLFNKLDHEVHPAERGNYYMAFIHMCQVTNTLHLIARDILFDIEYYRVKAEQFYSQKN